MVIRIRRRLNKACKWHCKYLTGLCCIKQCHSESSIPAMIKNIAKLLWDKWCYSVFHWISNKLSTLLHGAVVDIYPKYLLLDVASQHLESSMSKANILLEQERGYCSRSDHRKSGGGRVCDGFQAAQTTVLRKKIRKSDTISTPTNVCELSAKSLAKEHELTWAKEPPIAPHSQQRTGNAVQPQLGRVRVVPLPQGISYRGWNRVFLQKTQNNPASSWHFWVVGDHTFPRLWFWRLLGSPVGGMCMDRLFSISSLAFQSHPESVCCYQQCLSWSVLLFIPFAFIWEEAWMALGPPEHHHNGNCEAMAESLLWTADHPPGCIVGTTPTWTSSYLLHLSLRGQGQKPFPVWAVSCKDHFFFFFSWQDSKLLPKEQNLLASKVVEWALSLLNCH